MGATRLYRVCERGSCSLSVITLAGESTFRQWRADLDAAEVRHDARYDALVFTRPGARYAFHRATGEPVNVRAWHMASGRAPPRSWVLAALVGLATSALALAAFRRPPPSLLAWRGARAGLLSADGAITFGEGGADLRLPDVRGLTAGPVLVRFAHHALDDGPFRATTAHDVEAFAPGTLDDVEAAVAHVEDSAASLALLLATTACAPLLVEAACQLLV